MKKSVSAVRVKISHTRYIVVWIIAMAVALNGFAAPVDSCGNRSEQFKIKDIIAPVSMVAIGTAAHYIEPVKRVNEHIKDHMSNLRGDRYFHVDDYLQYAPIATYLALGAFGVSHHNSFKEQVAAGATAYACMTIAVNICKYTFRIKRPDSSARNSFPSGHSATVFTGAELIRLEYGNKIGGIAYAVATGVGFLRMYNERHWFNDVLCGAGIGILSAKIGYYMLPLYRRWFKWTPKFNCSEIAIIPDYNPYQKQFGLNVMIKI